MAALSAVAMLLAPSMSAQAAVPTSAPPAPGPSVPASASAADPVHSPAGPGVSAPVSVRATAVDAELIALINQARTAAGLPVLVQATGLTRLSVWWSNRLQNGTTAYLLEHNPDAWTMASSYGAANRRSWAENVLWSSSTATSARQLFTTYMNSPGHRANILSAGYRYIGVGTVTGAHGLFNTTEFTDAVQPGEAVVAVPKDGTFVTDTTTDAVYVIAGGAPVYVSNWAAVGGRQPTTAVSHDQLASWPVSPRDGTFVLTPGSGAVYRIVGGAPVYVSSWAPFGGVKPPVRIDPAAVARAGTGTYFDHVRVLPADGSFVRTPGTGAVYRIAGGAPVYVSSWTRFGGGKPSVDIDPAAVAKAGTGSYWNHLTRVPTDGTTVRTPNDGAVYRIAGGAPLYVTSWTAVGGRQPAVDIDPQAVTNAGRAGPWSHLLLHPVDSTYIQAGSTTAVYRVVGGRVTLVPWQAFVAGVTRLTVVDPLAIELAGTGGRYNHLMSGSELHPPCRASAC